MSAPTTSSTMASRLAEVLPELDPVATVTEAPSRRPRVRALATGAIVVVIAIVAALSGVFASSGSDYRTVAASTQNVNAALSGVATIEPQLEATMAFPAAGTVASVSVKVGDTVSAGQTLAQLDTQSLAQTVDQQMATLTQDQLTLTNATNGQSTTGGGLGGTGGTAGGSASATAGLSSAVTPAATHSGVLLAVRTAATSPAIAAAQQAVLAAQQQVDAAEGNAATALSTALSACALVTPTSPPAVLQTCLSDIQAVSAAQNSLASAQKALAAASNNLDQLLNQAASTPSTPAGTKPATSGGSSGGVGSGSAGRSSGAAAPTAADLSADQAAVDAALANVAVAQQALAQATLTSPINGTVDAVNLVAGASVTAGSTTENIVVRGSGGYQVSTTIGVDNIPHVAVGQAAIVVPDGAHKSLSGRVASISIAPNSTSALSTTYLVVIGLKHPNLALGNGSTGTFTITTQHAKSTLAVPTSAVTTSGTSHNVEVLDGNTPHRTRVRVGVVGYTWTQITSGLKQGQQVVLAQLSQPLPGSATSSSSTSNSSSNARTTVNGGGTPLFVGRGGGTGLRGG
ncbi:MAG TPA: biotin/lipoyl-binding protein [Acidimicrobiia bacterium]